MKTKEIRYPIYDRALTAIEKIALLVRKVPLKCTVCGNISVMSVINDNFRENCYCYTCKSFNRQRQIAYVLCNSLKDRRIRSLKDLHHLPQLAIYNTETAGALHKFFQRTNHYVCSEYFGDDHKSGDYVDGRMHQDLMSLSFADNQFDFVISTDVFEHIADPYVAHQEVYRVLKPGGRHIFTAPFYQTEILDEQRASVMPDGEIVHHKEPWYHVDPLRPDGVLTFTVFSLEMLVKLSKIGFKTNMHHLYRPVNGILGQNGLVFEAIKPPF